MSYTYQFALQNAATIATAHKNAFESALNQWAVSARAAGISEQNVTTVLQSGNAWIDGMLHLAGETIPREIMRVQQGGADGDISTFRESPPPPLPSFPSVLSLQGNVQVTTNPQTGQSSAIVPSLAPIPVELPPAVVASPSFAPKLDELVANAGVGTITNAPVAPVLSGVGGPIGPNPTQSAIDAPSSVPPNALGGIVSGSAAGGATSSGPSPASGSGFSFASVPWFVWAVAALGGVLLLRDS